MSSPLMPFRRSLSLTLVLTLALPPAATLTACAHPAAGSARLTPPVALDRLPYQDFPPEAVRFTVEVLVDSLGRPEPSSLRVIGSASAQTRAALERWVTYARFRPARQGGHPVAAPYRVDLKSEIRVERRGA